MPASPSIVNAIQKYLTAITPGSNAPANADVRDSALRIADASGFARGTPEHLLEIQKAAINHATNNADASGRVGGQELIDAVNAEIARGVDPVTGNYINTPPLINSYRLIQ